MRRKVLFRRIVGCFLFVGILLLLLSIYGARQSNIVGGYFDSAYTDSVLPYTEWVQFKLAVADIKGLLSRHVAETESDNYAKIEEQIRSKMKEVSGLLAHWDSSVFANNPPKTLTAEEQKGLDSGQVDISKMQPADAHAALKCYCKRMEGVVEKVIDNSSKFIKQDAANAMTSGDGRNVFAIIDGIALASLQRANNEITVSQKKSLEARDAMGIRMNIACTVVFLYTLALGVGLAKYILKPLARSVHLANAIADGDLAYQTKILRNDEIGDLLKAMNQMTSELRHTVKQIDAAAAEMATASEQQANGAVQQSSAIAQMSATTSELLTSARQMAENGTDASKQAELAANECAAGAKNIQDVMQGVATGIHERVSKIAEHMLSLGNKSQQISGVLDIINELSEQTNLLSLNASIEAAGAGEAGMRFAVVADEIRKLAERATESTKQIRDLVEGIQETVDTTLLATDEGAKAAKQGVAQTNILEGTFDRIAKQVASAAQSTKAIEMASRQQTRAIEQVNEAIGNINGVAKQFESTAKRVQKEAEALAKAAGRFRTDKEQAMQTQ